MLGTGHRVHIPTKRSRAYRGRGGEGLVTYTGSGRLRGGVGPPVEVPVVWTFDVVPSQVKGTGPTLFTPVPV